MHKHEVHRVEVGLDRFEGRVGVQRETGAQAEAAHLVDQFVGLAHLDVHRAPVRAGIGEVLQVPAGLGHHEVAIEEQRRVTTQRRHHRWSDGQIGHEVTVHDVHVQPIGRGRHLAHLLRQHPEVRREHRRRDPQVPCAPRVPVLGGGPCLHATGLPAQRKRAQQRMRRNP